MIVDRKKVLGIAEEVRRKAEKRFGKSLEESECLGGYCHTVTDALYIKLRENGIPAKWIFGAYEDPDYAFEEFEEVEDFDPKQAMRDGWDHSWVEVDGEILDITGDQYQDSAGEMLPAIQYPPEEPGRYWSIEEVRNRRDILRKIRKLYKLKKSEMVRLGGRLTRRPGIQVQGYMRKQ